MIPSNFELKPKILDLFVRKNMGNKSEGIKAYSKIPDYAHTRRVTFREVEVNDVC
jgi:hypothetical protein